MGCGQSYHQIYEGPIGKWRFQFQALKLGKRDVSRLYKIFRKGDTDDSGKIDILEMLNALDIDRNDFTMRLFSIFDEDGSGQIDFYEFVLALWNYCTLGRAALTIFSFDLYDRDGGGYLQKSEIEGMLRDIYGKKLHKNRHAEHILKELDAFEFTTRFDVDAFQSFAQTHQSLLFPAFEMQRILQAKALGASFWRRHSNKRIELSKGQYVKISEFLQLHVNKGLHEKVVHPKKDKKPHPPGHPQLGDLHSHGHGHGHAPGHHHRGGNDPGQLSTEAMVLLESTGTQGRRRGSEENIEYLLAEHQKNADRMKSENAKKDSHYNSITVEQGGVMHRGKRHSIVPELIPTPTAAGAGAGAGGGTHSSHRTAASLDGPAGSRENSTHSRRPSHGEAPRAVSAERGRRRTFSSENAAAVIKEVKVADSSGRGGRRSSAAGSSSPAVAAGGALESSSKPSTANRPRRSSAGAAGFDHGHSSHGHSSHGHSGHHEHKEPHGAGSLAGTTFSTTPVSGHRGGGAGSSGHSSSRHGMQAMFGSFGSGNDLKAMAAAEQQHQGRGAGRSGRPSSRGGSRAGSRPSSTSGAGNSNKSGNSLTVEDFSPAGMDAQQRRAWSAGKSIPAPSSAVGGGSATGDISIGGSGNGSLNGVRSRPVSNSKKTGAASGASGNDSGNIQHRNAHGHYIDDNDADRLSTIRERELSIKMQRRKQRNSIG